jgi:hypothetical protein
VRRAFAAPFVLIACTRPPPQEAFERPHRSWIVEQYGNQCFADGGDSCSDDSEHTCNPPAPTRVQCVYGDDFVDVHEIDGACWDGETKREVPCPDDVEIKDPPAKDAPPPHPRWLDDGPI